MMARMVAQQRNIVTWRKRARHECLKGKSGQQIRIDPDLSYKRNDVQGELTHYIFNKP